MMNKEKCIIVFGLLMIIQVNAVRADNKLIRFPGEISKIISPDRNHCLYNVDDERNTLPHTLILKDLRTKKTERLYSYARYVEVLWSPKGDSLIVNDHGSSNFANCIIFSFNREKAKFDVGELLRREMSGSKNIFGNHHVYIEGIEWLGEIKVKLRISGYGDVDPAGVTLWYEYTIGNALKFVKKGPLEEK